MSESGDNFFSRWSRRKRQGQRGEALTDASVGEAPPAAGAVAPVATHTGAAATAPLPPPATEDIPSGPAPVPLPTMDDVARATPQSDFSGFMRPGVDESVQRAAMKKLFTDPHYNTMDGLDTYIEDFNQTTPLTASMLRKMVQARALGLIEEEPQSPAAQGTVVSTDGAAPADLAQSESTPVETQAPPPVQDGTAPVHAAAADTAATAKDDDVAPDPPR